MIKGLSLHLRVLFLVVAGLWLASSPAGAAEPRFSVFPGYGGFFRPGEWTPVSVLIENADMDATRPYSLKGELRLVVTPLAGDTTIYSHKVQITQQQRALVTLYGKISSERKASVEFREEGGRKRWGFDLETQLSVVEPHQTLAVIATEQASLYRPRGTPGLRDTLYTNMTPMLLPGIWNAYESIDLLILPRDISSGLADESRRQALRKWLQFGGRLAVIGGRQYQTFKNSFLAPDLPVEIGEGAEVTLEDPRGAPVRLFGSTFRVKPDAGAVWTQQGRPLAARRAVGAGETTYIGVDMETDTAVDVPAMRAFWDTVAFAPGFERRHALSESLVYRRADLAFGRAARLPSLLLILLLLAAYTVLVGPVNFYILSKRRRLELAWFTIPIIVAGFAAMIYGIGAMTKGGLRIVRELDLIEAVPSSAVARVEKMAAVFSPEKQKYTLEVPGHNSAICAVWSWKDKLEYNNWWNPSFGRGVGGNSPIAGDGWSMTIDESSNPLRVNERLIAQWSSQNFVSTSEAELGGAIEASAEYADAAINGTAANRSGVTLRNAMVLAGGLARPAGDFAPGDTFSFTFNFRPDKAAALASAENPQNAEFGGFSSVNRALRLDFGDEPVAGAQQNAENGPWVARLLRERIWDAWQNPPEGASAPETPQSWPILAGWVESPLTPLAYEYEADQYAYGGLLTMAIRPKAGPGSFVLPADDCASELVHLAINQTGEFSYIPEGGIRMMDGEAIYKCAPGFRDRQLEIGAAGLKIQAAKWEGSKIEIAAFNYSTDQWVKLDYDPAQIEYPLPAGFCNPFDGGVLVRVASRPLDQAAFNRGEPFELRAVQVGYEGRAI